MPEQSWPDLWRAWLRAQYGERLDPATLEAAVEACEALRGVWQPVLAAELDNGDLPFPNALPGLPDDPGRARTAAPSDGEEEP